MVPDVYAKIVAFQAMEEFAQQRRVRRTNVARATRTEAKVDRAASAQRREPSRLARLGTVFHAATAPLQGLVLVRRGERAVSVSPALGPDAGTFATPAELG